MGDQWPILAPAGGGGPAEPLGSAPSFSVVIAAYQAEPTLGDAIDSVLAQTLPALEIVVCDDGSTDGTAAVARSYGDAVRLVRRDNGGESAAKNSAVLAASGDFVAVLDADDVFLPRRLEALSWLGQQRPDLDVLLTDAHLAVDGVIVRNCYHAGWPFECADQPTEILRRNFVLGLAAVRRTRWLQVGGFDGTARLTADWDFFIRLLRSGSLAGLVDVSLAEYRLRKGTLSSDRIALVESRIATLERAWDRGGLRAPERAALDAALDGQRRELLARRAKAALLHESIASIAAARRMCLTVAMDGGFRPGSRAAAFAAACLPRLARRWLRIRERGTVEIGTGFRAPC